ncbi:HxlR family transcriptional regulator [Nakamurella sp. YIM 132087]|uniref:HxlR family transcriptional regulator n=1 Tax=Nakamurella alba TaxID=2665158 RepID=A0A7K1FPU6_9ACTN|nr:helix-turn-helix domain-containing protein [Nakamurella alba]MTD16165.1 HxlR family transcriptional regulator [Nakamurella alba]
MTTRTYGQFCGLTRGADLLGGRWSLPLVRDLLLGPARFTELLAGFPGMPTNQLTSRLRELEDAGVVRRVIGGERGIRYELTEWGRELEPVITALGRWGATRMDEPVEGEIVTVAGLATMLRTSFSGRLHAGPEAPTVFEVFEGDLVAHATVCRDVIEVATGPADHPDLRVSAGEHFRAFIAGEYSAAEYAALPDVRMEGDPALLEEFAALFRIPLELPRVVR